MTLVLRLANVDVIHRSSDGLVNLTQLCRAGGKQFKEWVRLKSTEAFMGVLATLVGIPTNDLIVYEGGTNDERASWGHPQVAIELAHWISPEFRVKVSRWVYELAATGKVVLGQEKSAAAIDEAWKSRVAELEEALDQKTEALDEKIDEYERLDRKHRSYTGRITRHKFKQGPCIYLWHNAAREHKIGISGTVSADINERLAGERVSYPNIQLLLLVFTPENERVETDTKYRFRKFRIGSSKEYFRSELPGEDIKQHILRFLEDREIPFTQVSDSELQQYNNPEDATKPASNPTTSDEQIEAESQEPPIPPRPRKHTLADYQELGHTRGLTLDEGQTLGKNSKAMNWTCSAGHSYQASFQLLRGFPEGSACLTCKGRQAKTLADYQALAASKGGSFLPAEAPLRTTDKVEGWKCGTCQHQWTATFYNVKEGHWCPKCSGNCKRGADDYEQAGRKWNLELVAGLPGGVLIKVPWRCTIHGDIVETNLVLLRRRKFSPCPQCRKTAPET